MILPMVEYLATLLAFGSLETPVTDLMKARLATGLPVLIKDDGVFVGKVDDAEVYGGLLRD